MTLEEEKIQLDAKQALAEILSSAYIKRAHAITQMLCKAMDEQGDPFTEPDLEYIGAILEIVRE